MYSEQRHKTSPLTKMIPTLTTNHFRKTKKMKRRSFHCWKLLKNFVAAYSTKKLVTQYKLFFFIKNQITLEMIT